MLTPAAFVQPGQWPGRLRGTPADHPVGEQDLDPVGQPAAAGRGLPVCHGRRR